MADPKKKEPSKEKVAEAIAYEQGIADEAAKIRAAAEEVKMDRALFMQLWPLLIRPIPEGFLSTVGVVTGKPYESTGIRSVQVQKNRMDNVLGPMWWTDVPVHHADGKLCHVAVTVHDSDGAVLVTRGAWGGVDRSNTLGNLYKGSYTNAAKQAFAQVGPGREVYIGVTDYDPDVDADAANQQGRPSAPAAQPTGSFSNAAERAVEDDELALRGLLARNHPSSALRREAHDAMEMIGLSPARRLRELRGAPDEAALRDLVRRAHARADEMAIQENLSLTP